MDDIPQWAKARACDLANAVSPVYAQWQPCNVHASSGMVAFARYIDEHEDPPLDPFEQAFSELYNDDSLRTNGAMIRAALRLGIELGKQS